MKILVFISLLLIVLSSCPYDGGRIYDAFSGKDRMPPEMQSFSLVDNSYMKIVYDEDVTVIDARLDDIPLRGNPDGTVLMIPLGRTLSRGEEAVFSITAEDRSGNTSRASLMIIGRNLEIPRAIINEISPKGSGKNTDRIEILFLEEGSSAGMIVSDGLPDDDSVPVILPDISVKPYDTVVIYWDTEPESYDVIYDNGMSGYIVSGGSDRTLSGTNGAVLLFDEMDGKIIDGVIYTTGESELCGGYGNVRTERAAEKLRAIGKWSGDAVSSLSVTATRVIARLPGGVDTDTSSDFFITETSGSTFGRNNIYNPYSQNA